MSDAALSWTHYPTTPDEAVSFKWAFPRHGQHPESTLLSVRCWDFERQTWWACPPVRVPGEVFSTWPPRDNFAVSPDGKQIAFGTEDVNIKRRYIVVLTLRGRQMPLVQSRAHPDAGIAYAWLPDNRHLVGLDKLGFDHGDALFTVWDTARLDAPQPRQTWRQKGTGLMELSFAIDPKTGYVFALRHPSPVKTNDPTAKQITRYLRDETPRPCQPPALRPDRARAGLPDHRAAVFTQPVPLACPCRLA